MILTPIILFVYNRPEHTKRTLDALMKNDLRNKSELFIFLDGPANNQDLIKIKELKNIIYNLKGFKKINITERKKNLGLAQSIIKGVSEVIDLYQQVIVLEDDLIITNDFLFFMNNALNFYKNNKKIFSISGYNIPIKIPRQYQNDIYLSYRSCSWGWGTWKDRWDQVDWEVKDFNSFIHNKKLQKKFNQGGKDLSQMLTRQMKGKIDSWAIRWCYTQFRLNKYCIYPVISKVYNIGRDGSGRHNGPHLKYLPKIFKEKEIILTHNLKINKKIIKNFKIFFNTSKLKLFLYYLYQKTIKK